ncbi:MAG TPA: ATP-binding cassette domain-containing protein [Chitinophagaceae bacterium]
MAHQPIIKTEALSYGYSRGAQTLTDINLRVERGAIYGFLGPNGSGKTTTLSLLLGLLKLQSGTIELFGKPLHADRSAILKKVGSLIESPSLYGHLTARENLEIYRPLYGMPTTRIEEVLKMAGLQDTGRKPVRSFSLGMKQRLAIALALLPRPELLILDEPANGLDPSGIIELRELIRQLNKDHGMTILISSHILAEVEKMVSHLGIIFNGRLLFQGSLQQLHRLQHSGSQLELQTSDNDAAMELLHTYRIERTGETLSLALEDIGQAAAVNRLLIHNDLDVYLLQPRKTDLEQIFINLTTARP